ncbi:hypothetical protein H6P1_00208 (plasmid) [Variovorax sp. PBL-H6]|nr:hypothetical protein H6P1_00208 [Variovorax sp. PBL-H6]VTU43883.1 hypothetical protein SRS16P1_00694 [Variovorax sp. SRS16]VTU43954.1 hypothetical protein E5P1_00687 [Variovorax sp. PBL-E5]
MALASLMAAKSRQLWSASMAVAVLAAALSGCAGLAGPPKPMVLDVFFGTDRKAVEGPERFGKEGGPNRPGGHEGERPT